MKELVQKIPAAHLRILVTVLFSILTAVGAYAINLEIAWRADLATADRLFTERLAKTQEQLSTITTLTQQLIRIQENQQQELVEYRREILQLRREQVESARDVQKSLESLEKGR